MQGWEEREATIFSSFISSFGTALGYFSKRKKKRTTLSSPAQNHFKKGVRFGFSSQHTGSALGATSNTFSKKKKKENGLIRQFAQLEWCCAGVETCRVSYEDVGIGC